MQTVQQCFISLIISYKVRKITALIRCTSKQVDTGHKLHFQPKNPARAKLAAINNKNGCGTAEVWCRQLGRVSYHCYYYIRSGKRQPSSVVLPTDPEQAISHIFSPYIQLGTNWQLSTTKMAVTWLRCNTDILEVFSSLILSYKVRKYTDLIRCTTKQVVTGHKPHFQPKHPVRAKLAAINYRHGCGTSEVWFR